MTLSTATSVALYSVLVIVLIFAVLTVALLFGIAMALRVLNARVDEALTKIEPVLLKATQTLDTVQQVTANIGERTNDILTRGETLTDGVARKVEHTATVVQRAVTTPLINISSAVVGVTETLASLNRNLGNVRQTFFKGTTSNGHKS